jgi:hypothetical protein
VATILVLRRLLAAAMPPSSSVSVTPVPPRRLRTLHWFATGKPLAGKPTLDTHFTRRSWPKRVAAARVAAGGEVILQ